MFVSKIELKLKNLLCKDKVNIRHYPIHSGVLLTVTVCMCVKLQVYL